jgi:hypothetical protein
LCHQNEYIQITRNLQNLILLSEPELPDSYKSPSTKSLPIVCYSYFSEFENFQNFIQTRGGVLYTPFHFTHKGDFNMKRCIFAFFIACLFANAFAQEEPDYVPPPAADTAAAPPPEPTPAPAPPAPAPLPALVAALPKLSVAQALSGVNLSGSCVGDFTSLLEKDGFDMAKFMKELPQDVAKVKLKMKSPFGKPKDSDKTGSGLSVGCVKALPESPSEIASLLKDISLKMGLDLAAGAAEDFAGGSIPANIPNEGRGGVFGTVMSISLAAGGLAAIVYGVMQNDNVSSYVDSKRGKAAVDAEKSRNMSYGIGAALLAGGLIIYLVF